MAVKIVPMNADHIDEVAKLEKLCFSRPWSRDMLKEEMDNACAALLVAEEDGKVLGYAGLQVILDEGYIMNVAVQPEHRQKGIASKLIRVFIDFAKANHMAFLTLEVRPSNMPAIMLYGHLGFRTVGRRNNYYEHPTEDALIMTLTFSEEGEAE